MTKVVIIIPTYNERENIRTLIPKIVLQTKLDKTWDWQILIIDDNSPDGTGKEVIAKSRKFKNVHLLSRTKKSGLGAAYLAGMSEAFNKMKADVVIIMDADLSHNPIYLPKFKKALENGADFCIGARNVDGGSIPKDWPLHRKFLSVFGNITTSLLLGNKQISDWTSGYRAITKKVYRAVSPQIVADRAEFRGYTFNIAYAYHVVQNNFKVSQVPIHFPDRQKGESKLGLEYLFHTPIFLIRARLKKIFKV